MWCMNAYIYIISESSDAMKFKFKLHIYEYICIYILK